MKNCLKPIMMAIVAIAMISGQDYVVAQSRRSSTSSSSRSTTTNSSSPRASASRSGAGSPSVRPSSSRQSTSPSPASIPSSQSRRQAGSSVSRSGSSVGTSAGSSAVKAPSSPRGTYSPRSTSASTSARPASSGSSRSVSRTGISASQAARGTVGTGSIAPAQQARSSSASSGSRSGNVDGRVVAREPAADAVNRGYSGNDVRHAAGTLNPVQRSRDIGPRIPPRERRVMVYDRPGCFCSHTAHYFGYRVSYLPPEFVHVTFWGRTYCCYNGIYYRPWGSYYVVCRPPFGVIFDWVIEDIARTAVTFAYYSNVNRTYNIIDENYNTILEQNKIIAQNNATIAAQNSQLALNAERADASYALADNMELVQSYADASVEYFYEDGVFFTKGADGKYVTIVPPVGALVTALPDDYETFTVDGVDYYKVDDTIYKLSVINATPYFEVVGQLTGEKAAKYDVYK